MRKIFIAAAIFCLCSCSEVKNESVRVTLTDLFPNAFIIQVGSNGKYYIYIPNEADRLKFANMTSLKAEI